MSKGFKDSSSIRDMAQQRERLVKTEYTNYDEYMDAQKKVHDYFFSQLPKTCELCGYPMDYNNHKLTEWEAKWSIHEVCKKKMDSMLDRETGIARERKAVERQKERMARRQRPRLQ